jgi:hypothetical protein
VAGTRGYGEGFSGSINAGNFLTSCKVYWLASQVSKSGSKQGSIWNDLFFELPASLVLRIEIKTLCFWNTFGFRPHAKLEAPTELGPIEKAIVEGVVFGPSKMAASRNIDVIKK